MHLLCQHFADSAEGLSWKNASSELQVNGREVRLLMGAPAHVTRLPWECLPRPQGLACGDNLLALCHEQSHQRLRSLARPVGWPLPRAARPALVASRGPASPAKSLPASGCADVPRRRGDAQLRTRVTPRTSVKTVLDLRARRNAHSLAFGRPLRQGMGLLLGEGRGATCRTPRALRRARPASGRRGVHQRLLMTGVDKNVGIGINIWCHAPFNEPSIESSMHIDRPK